MLYMLVFALVIVALSIGAIRVHDYVGERVWAWAFLVCTAGVMAFFAHFFVGVRVVSDSTMHIISGISVVGWIVWTIATVHLGQESNGPYTSRGGEP